MGRNKKPDTIKVNNKVSLRKTNQSPYYQAYFRLDGRTYRPSTGTNDIDAAKDKALDLYVEARANPKPKHQPISFQKCADSYLAAVQHDGKHGYHRDTMRRHLMPYFGSYGDLTRIKTADIDNYVAHRRSTPAKSPKPSTVNRENTVLRQMLKYAERQGWIDKAPEIPHLSESQTRERGRHFSRSEIGRLLKASGQRIKQAQLIGQLHHVLENRRLLHDTIVFMVNTGARAEEVPRITWHDVDLSSGQITLINTGKGRRTRRINLNSAAAMALRRIKLRRLDWMEQHGQGTIPLAIAQSERVFILPDGTSVKQQKRAFEGLVAAAGLTPPKGQKGYSLTSLRHTFATLALTDPKQPATVRSLATTMGTSVAMIERHYGHDEATSYVFKLNA